MVYECAQGQLASWKVTECNLVNHKLDMQAAADRESYTHAHAHTYTTHKQASKLSFSHTQIDKVLYKNVSGKPLIQPSTVYLTCFHKYMLILLLCTPTINPVGPGQQTWSEHTGLVNALIISIEIMVPLPAQSFFGCIHAPVDWLICEGYTRIDAQAFFFCWRMLPPTGHNCTLQLRNSLKSHLIPYGNVIYDIYAPISMSYMLPIRWYIIITYILWIYEDISL